MRQLSDCFRMPEEPRGPDPRDRARSIEVLDIWQDYKRGRIAHRGFQICLAVHTVVGVALGEFGYKQLPRMDDEQLKNFRRLSPLALEKLKKADESYYQRQAEKAKRFRDEQERVELTNTIEARDLKNSGEVLLAAHEDGLGDFTRELALLQREYQSYRDSWKTDPVILKRARDRVAKSSAAEAA